MKKVLCSGTFDILHKGHEEFLKDAKKQGDYLIVNVIPDKQAYENKKKKVVNSQKIRVLALKKLKIADKINPVTSNFNETLKLIARIKPHVIAIGYDQKTKKIQKVKDYLKKERH